MTTLDPIADEPQDVDAFLSPIGRLGAQTGAAFAGRHLGVFDSEPEAEQAILDAMERQQFWPNCWWIDDHGGHTLRRLAERN